MKVTVCFLDGAVEVFDTDALTTESPLGPKNVLTDLKVTLHEGLWVEASWYQSARDHGDGGDMPLAQRSPGCRLHVLSRSEIEDVRSINIDGTLRWLRVGPDLCDVAILDDMTELLYDAEEPSSCMAGKAVWLHDHLKEWLPEVSRRPDGEEDICAILGLTEGSYEFLSGLSASVDLEENYD